ncbi:hypothetical protein [Croceibacterium salegens]|uniref:hypothetical protein n=1 Tax=Croceibacterium salegens TaxID=1737568 RepID=UPI001F437F53|nr:hypothetical protein [Croceibacterium salegens]
MLTFALSAIWVARNWANDETRYTAHRARSGRAPAATRPLSHAALALGVVTAVLLVLVVAVSVVGLVDHPPSGGRAFGETDKLPG